MNLILCLFLLLLGSAAVVIVLGILWIGHDTPSLDAWRDAHASEPSDYTARLEYCRQCGNPKFARRNCWQCNNGRELARIVSQAHPSDPSHSSDHASIRG